MYQVSEKLIHAVISGKLLNLPEPQFTYIPDRGNLRTPAVDRGFLESRQGREKAPFRLQRTARQAEPHGAIGGSQPKALITFLPGL